MNNIKVLKKGINVRKVIKQLEKYSDDWYIEANSPYNDGWVREYYQGLIDEEHKDYKEGDRCKESTQAT